MKKTTKGIFTVGFILACLFNLPFKSFAQFTIFNTSNSGLPSNFVHASGMDSKNNLWIGTEGGLTKYTGTVWKTYNTTNSHITANWVQTIEVVDTNEIWIGTRGFKPGLSLFNGDSIVRFDTINGSATPTDIYALKKDQSGNLWIGADYVTFKYDGVNLINIGSNGPHYANSFEIKNGILWVGTYGYGLYKYDGLTWTNYNMSNSGIPSNFVQKIAIDTSNNIWMGGYSGSSSNDKGLIKFDGTTWTNYNTSNSSIPRDPIFDIVIDSNENLWIANGDGNNPGGLVKFNGTTFTLTNTSNSNLPTNIFLDLDIDNLGRLVLSTYAYGICFYQLAIGINDIEPKNPLINVFPNPVLNHINITTEQNSSQNSEIEIVNYIGQTVLRSPYANSIDVSKLNSGIYTLKVNTKDNQSYYSKFVKE